jgi:hypothetical protein
VVWFRSRVLFVAEAWAQVEYRKRSENLSRKARASCNAGFPAGEFPQSLRFSAQCQMPTKMPTRKSALQPKSRPPKI